MEDIVYLIVGAIIYLVGVFTGAHGVAQETKEEVKELKQMIQKYKLEVEENGKRN